MLTNGIWKHYKGKLYLGFPPTIAAGDERKKRPSWCATYQPLYGKFRPTRRDLDQFNKRFRLVYEREGSTGRDDLKRIVKALRGLARRRRIGGFNVHARYLLTSINVSPVEIVATLNLLDVARSR